MQRARAPRRELALACAVRRDPLGLVVLQRALRLTAERLFAHLLVPLALLLRLYVGALLRNARTNVDPLDARPEPAHDLIRVAVPLRSVHGRRRPRRRGLQTLHRRLGHRSPIPLALQRARLLHNTLPRTRGLEEAGPAQKVAEPCVAVHRCIHQIFFFFAVCGEARLLNAFEAKLREL